jgi:2-polyprenyl-6-methoxyphenol hydroxylase-like FAD-dependent oxidoreductase
MREETVPVLIAGGSLVGLSAAVCLGWHGVRSLVVERHRGTAIHPRAAYFNQRTFEIYRSVGLEAEIVRRAHEEFLQDGAIMAVESLAGRELAWFVPSLNEGVRDVSPSMRLYCTQNVLEPILRRRAEELGTDTHFGSEVVSFRMDGGGVLATVRDLETGSERNVRARYLIGADGNRSPVRRHLGIAMSGRGTFSNSATIYFRADIRPALRDRPLSVIYVNNASLKGFMRFEAHGLSGFLAVNVAYGSGGEIVDIEGDADEALCVQLVRAAIGVPDLRVEIVAVQPWKAAAETAERFREGPVFLAGDAAHVMPPTGGFGGNTGVHDAHNLAWKLAYVLKGLAGPELLATYDLERRPVGTFTVEQAYTRYVKRTDPSLGEDDIQPQEDDLRIELGARYRSAAVCPVEQNGNGVHAHPRESRAMPGTRAPHLVLKRDGSEISTLDLFGRNFTLLAGPNGAAWCRAARAVAAELALGLDAVNVGDARGLIEDPEGKFPEAYGIEPAGCVLVRPDGFVAWRSRTAQEAPEQALAYSLRHLLCRAPEPSRRSEAA